MNKTILDRKEIRAARTAKPEHNPWQPIGQDWEIERGVHSVLRETLTVYLTGAECPFTCLFCDLWQHTLPRKTPVGALPKQLAIALNNAATIPENAAIKLYNASNFFDPHAVPIEDFDKLANLCDEFVRITVESHPKFLGERCEAFHEMLFGRLEVALGLETIHPVVFPRLKDGMTLSDFDCGVEWAKSRGIGVRAFVLVGLPWVPAVEFPTWAARSTARAFEAGADRVSLIPLRTDDGILRTMREKNKIEPVTLGHLEDALAASFEVINSETSGIIEADIWNVEALIVCQHCAADRIERLKRANQKQYLESEVPCHCTTA